MAIINFENLSTEIDDQPLVNLLDGGADDIDIEFGGSLMVKINRFYEIINAVDGGGYNRLDEYRHKVVTATGVPKYNHKGLAEWLLPLGYKEIYRDDNQVNFIKGGIRVCCDSYTGFYLQTNVFAGIATDMLLSIKTGRYVMYTSQLEEVYNKFVGYLKEKQLMK